MLKKREIACISCKALNRFEDEAELKQMGWVIVGWNIEKNLPVCYCKKCVGHDNDTDKSKSKK